MRYNHDRRGRGAYRYPKMRRQHLEVREQALETNGVNENEIPAIHCYPAAYEATETQSSVSYSSSSSFSSSSVPTRPSRRRTARRGRQEGNLLHRTVKSHSPAPGFPPSSSPPSSSPLDDCFTFSSSYPSSSSSPSPLVDTSEEPIIADGNANMLTLPPPRSHNPPFSRGRGRGKGWLLRTAAARTSTTTTLETTAASATTARTRETPEQPSSQPLPRWKHWESVAIILDNVPLGADTFTLWKAFSKEGNIFSIDLYTDIHGNRDSKAKIRFK